MRKGNTNRVFLPVFVYLFKEIVFYTIIATVLFFKRIYREWRSLFWILLLLLLAQAGFMAKGIQNLPFFLYNMYSRDEQPRDSLAVYLVKTPQGYYNHKALSGREQEMLMNSIGYYDNLKRDGDGTEQTIDNRFKGRVPRKLYMQMKNTLFNNIVRLDAFPTAWGRYYKEVGDTRFDSVSVVKSYIYRKSPFQKSPVDSVLFTVKIK